MVDKKKICSVAGCTRIIAAKGYCMRHYGLVRRNGSPYPKRVPKTGCKVSGCTADHCAKGYCHNHYEQFRTKGSITITGRKSKVEECSIAGCTNDANSKGLCVKHYSRYKKTGTTKLLKKEYINKNNVCVKAGCNGPANSGGLCKLHYKKGHYKLTYEDRKQRSVCVVCEAPVIGQMKCKSCKAKEKEKRETLKIERLRVGACIDCGATQDIVACAHISKVWKSTRERLLCRKHYFKWVAKRHGGVKNAKMIEDLWNKQMGRCAYTGRRLTLGKDASIDHKIPRSDNGKNTKENMHWVHWDVNVAKGALSEADFYALCHEILEHKKGKRNDEN